MTRWRQPALALAGVAAGGFVVLQSRVSTYHLPTHWQAMNLPIIVAVGWSFIFVGMMATARRPENRVGALMTLVGFTWFIYSVGLIRTPLTYAIAIFSLDFYQVVLGHLFVVFPHGHARTSEEQRIIRALYAWFVVDAAAITFSTNTAACVGAPLGCPHNPVYIAALGAVRGPINACASVVTAVLATLVVRIVVRHWRQASPPARRALAPAFWALGPTLAVILVLQLPVGPTKQDLLPFYGVLPANSVQAWLNPIEWVTLAIVPMGFLAGLLRTRLGRAAVGDLVMTLARNASGAEVERALATALGDPSLELLLALPEGGGFVDTAGHSRQLPDTAADRGVTLIDGEGRRIAAILHDRVLLEDDPGLVAAAGAAARLAIENARLHADVTAQLEEVRASRMRIVQAGDAARRRVERDLHDGAQQRLLAVTLALGMARRRAEAGGDPELVATIDQASAELTQALQELRELARGVHPAVLSRSGLKPALRSLAERSSVPVQIGAVPTERFPAAVESTVYFLVSEALANVAKHAQASQCELSAWHEDGRLRVEIRDDGVGGADAHNGSGLSGLADRVAALDGTLAVRSPPGGGTCIVAQIPCV